jgi:hypothetical protein
MFEKATKLKLRFDYKGVCTVEDLWDLSVKELDSMYKTENTKLKQSQEDSLLNTQTKEDVVTKLKVDIIKHIVEVKLAEAEARENAKERKMKKMRLTEILASKQDADLQGKSTEEIQKMIDELG